MLGTDGADGGAALAATLAEVSAAPRGFLPAEGGGDASAAYVARVGGSGMHSRNLLAVFNFGNASSSVTLNAGRLGLGPCTAPNWILCPDVWNSSAAAAVAVRGDGDLVVPVDVFSSRLLRCTCSPKF